MYFKQIPLNKILFLDIETVPAYASYNELPNKWRKLWDTKAGYINKDNLPEEEFYRQAGIYAEFGKVVAISMAFVTTDRKLRVKTIYGDNEKCILENFARIANEYFNKNDTYLCAHNGKEFDFPYLARRMLVNQVPLPQILDIHGRKPWETQFLDTMELWKFGDYKHFTSLELLTALFDLPNPKTETSGKDVWRLYWEEKDLERIAEYCEKDTISVVQVFLRFRGEEYIPSGHIQIAERTRCE